MSAKLSTTSDNTQEDLQKEIAQELITGITRDIARAKLMETYYTRCVVLGNNQAQMLLGRTQSQIKEWEALLTFLHSHVDTLS